MHAARRKAAPLTGRSNQTEYCVPMGTSLSQVLARQHAGVVLLLLLVASVPNIVSADSDDGAPPVPVMKGIQPQLMEVPDGFSTDVWAKDLPNARQLASVQVNGSTIVYVGSVGNKTNPGSDVYYIVDKNSDGKPDFRGTLLKNIQVPNGVAVQGADLFVPGFEGSKGMIWRLQDAHKYALQNKSFTGNKTVVTDKLPGDPGHGRRFLRFSPEGLLLLGIGAPCNVCKPQKTRQGVWYNSLYSVNVTSGELRQVAAGIRNSVGFDWSPITGELFFTDNGRDKIGDDSPDCELNRLPANAPKTLIAFDGPGANVPNFGFPYCQTQGLGNPYQRDLGGGVPLTDPDLNANSSAVNCTAPDAYIQAFQAQGPHTAPLGMRFYRWRNTSAAFPPSYNNTIFIAQHGSWNRALLTGYRVMMLKLDPAGQKPVLFQEFARGFLQNENSTANFAWGRPVDVEQLPDGSLLISDDENGAIYRVAYNGTKPKLADSAVGGQAPSKGSSIGQDMPQGSQTSRAGRALRVAKGVGFMLPYFATAAPALLM